MGCLIAHGSSIAWLVKDVFAARSLPDAGIRVVSAVGMKPPHDGCSRMGPLRVSVEALVEGRDLPFSVEVIRPGPLRQIRECDANRRSRLQLLMLMGTLC